ncbi:MAG: hypothetical protein PWP07_2066 [Epulopiscium sp.]|nr:hypothetical protein [Candidatus Epulonipiscium sp.]
MLFPYVSFVIPYALYLPDDVYPVNLNKEVIHVRTSFLPFLPQPDGVQISGPNVELFNDVFGYAGKTKLEFLFVARPTNQTYLTNEEEKKLLEDGIKVCNRIIEVYRVFDRNSLGIYSFHVIPLTAHDLSMKTFGLADENFNLKPESKVVKPLRNTVAVGAEVVKRSEDVIKNIKEKLISGESLPLEILLLRSAQNHLWRSEYWQVPLEMNIAFETVVTNLLIKTMKLLNDMRPIPEAFFDRLVHTQKYVNRWRRENGLDEIQWLDAKCKGWKYFKACPEIMAWKIKCYELRCRVVHEGYLNVTKEEANNSIQAAFEAIQYLYKLLPI